VQVFDGLKQCWNEMTITIKKSRIHGRGIFANRDFKKGEVVLKWDSLLGELNKNIVVSSPGKHLNHSCNANIVEVDGKNIAVRDILKGEEITCNYVKDKVPFLKMECNCRSEDCNKIILGELFN